jgi:hypothetical protein
MRISFGPPFRELRLSVDDEERRTDGRVGLFFHFFGEMHPERAATKVLLSETYRKRTRPRVLFKTFNIAFKSGVLRFAETFEPAFRALEVLRAFHSRHDLFNLLLVFIPHECSLVAGLRHQPRPREPHAALGGTRSFILVSGGSVPFELRADDDELIGISRDIRRIGVIASIPLPSNETPDIAF